MPFGGTLVNLVSLVEWHRQETRLHYLATTVVGS